MTANELITRAEYLIEEKYNNLIWYGFIKDVLRELTPVAKLPFEAAESVTLTDGWVTVDLTEIDNLYDIVSVSFKPTGSRPKPLRRIAVQDTVSSGWSRMGDELRLQNLPYANGEVVIGYYEHLRLLEEDGDYYYNMPEGYDEVLLKGICAYAMQKEEEFDRKQDFYGEYMLGKRRMLMERTMAMEPWNTQAIMQMGGEG